MTAAECQDALVRFLCERGQWVPVADVIVFMEGLGLTKGQGHTDLKTLHRTGRIEKRRSADTLNAFGTPATEWRASGGGAS